MIETYNSLCFDKKTQKTFLKFERIKPKILICWFLLFFFLIVQSRCRRRFNQQCLPQKELVTSKWLLYLLFRIKQLNSSTVLWILRIVNTINGIALIALYPIGFATGIVKFTFISFWLCLYAMYNYFIIIYYLLSIILVCLD